MGGQGSCDERRNRRRGQADTDGAGRWTRRTVAETGRGQSAPWSPESPDLYTLVQEIRIGGATVDERRTRFGIRTISLDADKGLRINGRRVLLRGGNIHHDNYMIGAAGAPDADARKVALMKAAGYNAIRSAHNPASQATLDAADELGMLVIDEAFDSWNKSKSRRTIRASSPKTGRRTSTVWSSAAQPSQRAVLEYRQRDPRRRHARGRRKRPQARRARAHA